jgi:hypothetical protein
MPAKDIHQRSKWHSICDEFVRERERQVGKKFGGDTNAFDLNNMPNDWVAYITAYAGRAADKVARNERERQTFRGNLIKVGAIVVAAIEAHDKSTDLDNKYGEN